MKLNEQHLFPKHPTLVFVLFGIIMTGCGILPSIPAYTYVNEEQEGGTPVPRANHAPLNASGGNAKIFVGIAISGGGSRAAVFGAAVLEELDRAGFLDHVTTISSVSGGSLPAAYFALNGETIHSDEEWNSFNNLMRKSFRTTATFKFLLPHNFLLTALTDYDRTDIMAEVFDDALYNNRAFGELGQRGPRRPALLINATELTGESGRNFTFSEDMFTTMNSRLDTFPISKAVAASSAFPGLMNPVTLRNYFEIPGKSPLPTKYVHLMDAGPSDNLGATSLLAAARAHSKNFSSSNACFMFLIDAHPSLETNSQLFSRDLRDGLLEHFINYNFLDSVDLLLIRRRATTLHELGISIPTANPSPLLETDPIWPKNSRGLLGNPWFTRKGYQRVANSPLSRQDKSLGECTIWHIAMSEVASLPPTNAYLEKNASSASDINNPIFKFREQLQKVAVSIQTDFNLVGPKEYCEKQLQQTLRDIAHILVNEDDKSRTEVCGWFSKHFPNSKFRCGEPINQLRQKNLPAMANQN
ncbi:MAG: patatin-like phospholipase family protein [Nitrosomonas sp.]